MLTIMSYISAFDIPGLYLKYLINKNESIFLGILCSVRFVDIGGIGDHHHCLNFLFTSNLDLNRR